MGANQSLNILIKMNYVSDRLVKCIAKDKLIDPTECTRNKIAYIFYV